MNIQNLPISRIFFDLLDLYNQIGIACTGQQWGIAGLEILRFRVRHC